MIEDLRGYNKDLGFYFVFSGKPLEGSGMVWYTFQKIILGVVENVGGRCTHQNETCCWKEI